MIKERLHNSCNYLHNDRSSLVYIRRTDFILLFFSSFSITTQFNNPNEYSTPELAVNIFSDKLIVQSIKKLTKLKYSEVMGGDEVFVGPINFE